MKKEIKDLTGLKFGNLNIVENYGKIKGSTYWKCLCDCGNVKIINHYNLLKGKSTSCGCLKGQKISKKQTTHNKTNTKIYKLWMGIKSRCNNINNPKYKSYGGRGIKVCDEWQNDFMSFYNWTLANGYDENAKYGECTIERINVNGNYEPNNCTFKNLKEQANNKTTNVFVEYNGETHTLKQWSEIFNLKYKSMVNRYHLYLDGKTEFIKTLDDVFSNADFRKAKEIKLTYNNKTLTISEWSKLLNINKTTIWSRYKKGFCVEDILYKGNLGHKNYP